MQVKSVSSCQSFKGATVIKTTKPLLINFLNDVDFSHLKRMKNPKARFYSVATSTSEKGIFKGILLDGKDAVSFNINAPKTAEKTISSIDDILALPALKGMKKMLSEQFSKF